MKFFSLNFFFLKNVIRNLRDLIVRFNKNHFIFQVFSYLYFQNSNIYLLNLASVNNSENNEPGCLPENTTYALLSGLLYPKNADKIEICGNAKLEEACKSIFTTETKPDFWCPALIAICNFTLKNNFKFAVKYDLSDIFKMNYRRIRSSGLPDEVCKT